MVVVAAVLAVSERSSDRGPLAPDDEYGNATAPIGYHGSTAGQGVGSCR